MTPDAIAAFLFPNIEHSAQPLPETLLVQISLYLDLLLRWNARTNLTAVRSPEEILSRHFGESFFAAQQLFPAGNSDLSRSPAMTLADVGSGAGFPGLPIKLWSAQSGPSQLHVTLIESHQKKAIFLREVIRTLKLTAIEVQATRAQQIRQTFDVVTLRAVEQFSQVLPAAARLLNPGGRLALLIGEDQVQLANSLLPTFQWEKPQPTPNSQHRVILAGVFPA